MRLSNLPAHLRAGVAALFGAVTLAACATDSPSAVQRAAPAAVAFSASVPRTSMNDGPASVRITVSYLRQTGATVTLGSPQTFALAQNSQQVPVAVDVATCLADATRAGAGGNPPAADECLLQLELEFLVSGVRVDRQLLTNVSVKPGQTATVTQPVALAQVTDVRLVVPTANQQSGGVRLERDASATLGVQVIDANNQPVVGRPVVWSSTNSAVATVDANGVVRGVAIGSAQITASVAGREVSTNLSVVPASRTITLSSSGTSGAGRVQSSPAGIDCTVQNAQTSGTCSAVFAGDVLVSMGASAATGSALVSLGGDCTMTSAGVCAVAAGGPTRAVTVAFRLLRGLTVTLAGDGEGTVSSVPGTIDCRRQSGNAGGSCSEQYGEGTTVQLSATAIAGSVFLGWSGDCAGASACSVTMSTARTVTARFARLRSVRIAAGLGAGRGTITSQPAGINCVVTNGSATGSCVANFAPTTTVVLNSAPDATSAFAGWSSGCTGVAGCSIVIADDVTVGANFVGRRALTVALNGLGAGAVVSSPGVISCLLLNGSTSGICADSPADGSLVQLSATAQPGSVFAGWSGACAGTGQCLVTMTAARAVNATFNRQKTLTVTGAGTGSGSVSSSPGGIGCTVTTGVASGACRADFGTPVTLSASPATGFEFAGWGGACAGTESCAVSMSDDATVSASFRPASARLTVTVTGGAGSVETELGAPCVLATAAGSTTCTYQSTVGRAITLTASPGTNVNFGGWSGACSGSEGCRIVMDADKAVTATFARRTVSLTLTVSGSGAGTISAGEVSCTLSPGQSSNQCTGQVPAGQVIVVNQSAAPLSEFVAWGGACGGSSSCQIVASGSTSVSATFNRAPMTVEVSGSGVGVVVLGSASSRCTFSTSGTIGTCSVRVPLGQSITLSIDPTASFPFLGWGGACSGTALSCTLTAQTSGAVGVSARFQSPP